MKYSCLERIVLVSLVYITPAAALTIEKQIAGWVEEVIVMPGEMNFKAKLDTGALTSSINAKDIVEFERDGEIWIRFEIINDHQESKVIELPQVRTVKIKRHFGKSQKRHVVNMGFCLGDVFKETQVSLVNREKFIYKLLIGRRFIRDNFIVDPSEHHMTSPECKLEKK